MTKKTTVEKIDHIGILLAVIVAVIALLVRMPSAFLVGLSEEAEEAYTDDTGLPYFTDPDSYYHVRLVDTMLRTGKIADTISPDGEPWDSHSFYPEGRNAAYESGIVYLTIALWKIFNLSAPIDISRVEFYLAGFMAMFTALGAYIAGYRINGKISGAVAGILMGCAPEFVGRTSFGRFDTDIFVVLMNTLLILFLTELLRTDDLKKQLTLVFCFILTAIVYANCWATRFSMLFVGLTIVAGLTFSAINTLITCREKKLKGKNANLFLQREFIILIVTGFLILIIIGITMGFSTVRDIFQSLSLNMTQETSDGALPNMLEFVAELSRPQLVPESPKDWFRGYMAGTYPTVITGVGGAFATMAATGGLLILGLRSLGWLGVKEQELPEKNECLLYLVILGMWTIVGLYLTRSGMRFIEMLTVPISILAGIFAGWVPKCIKNEGLMWRIGKIVVSITVISAIIFPDMEGFFLDIRLPSVTDASANAMKWIKENANDPEAVIESWWDYGYYYESESGHPCLWDGGTQEPIRAILFSRAMVEKDMERSSRILNMLACSGNEAIDLLMESTDPRNAFEVLWEVLTMETEDSCRVISEKNGLSEHDARKVESLIHPSYKKEAYLVLTYTMAGQIGGYEYYSDWDFTGTQRSLYRSDNIEDQVPTTDTEKEKSEDERDGYTMCRLFFDVEDNPYFTPVYEYNDGIEGVRVWRINSI